MNRISIAAAAVAMLAGCASGPTPEEIAAADDATCASYGMPAGHPDYGKCRLALNEQRIMAAQAYAARLAGIGALAGAMQPPMLPSMAASAQQTRCTAIPLYNGATKISCY